MHQIVTDIEIETPPAAIWSILTDFESYPEWNPFFRKVDGTPEKGARLTVTAQPPSGRELTFHPVVLECVENRELRWQGRLLFRGLFDGERFFRIETVTPGRSRFVHGEYFSGLLVPPLKRYLDRSIRAGFIEMNQALKSRAEHG